MPPTTKPYHHVLFAAPFIILSIVPFILLADPLNIEIDGRLVALGALGWWIALLLRAPAILLARKLPHQTAQTLMTAVSGPAEEIVRLVLLLILGLTLGNAYSVGLGWALIEILYSLLQGFGMAALQQKTDPKAEEAKRMLRTMGMEKAMRPEAAYWGIVERIGANALHLSFSVLLYVSPWLVLLTIPAHSLANFGLTRYMRRSLAGAEIAFVAASISLLTLTLWLATR